MNVSQVFSLVLEYARKWKVSVRFLEPTHTDFRDEFHAGPDHGWVYWPKRTIYWPEPEKNDEPQSLLHEIGHCVVGTSPEDTEEVTSGLLAFQLFSSRHLHLRQWFRWSRNFEVECYPGGPFTVRYDSRSHTQRGRVLRESLRGAIKAGILTPQGEPTFKKARRKRRSK